MISYREYFPFVVIGFFVVLLVGGMAWTRFTTRKRAEAMSQAAGELGFDFEAQPGSFHREIAGMGNFHLFRQGRSCQSRNVLRGTFEGQPVALFDYRYITGQGKHRRTWDQTVAAVELREASLPEFHLRPEGFWHKVGGAFGVQDIDFDSHPHFSKKYLLQGPDEDAIRDRFAPVVLDDFEDRPGLCVESGAGWLIVFRDNKRVAPADLRSLLEESARVATLFRSAGPRLG